MESSGCARYSPFTAKMVLRFFIRQLPPDSCISSHLHNKRSKRVARSWSGMPFQQMADIECTSTASTLHNELLLRTRESLCINSLCVFVIYKLWMPLLFPARMDILLYEKMSIYLYQIIVAYYN